MCMCTPHDARRARACTLIPGARSAPVAVPAVGGCAPASGATMSVSHVAPPPRRRSPALRSAEARTEAESHASSIGDSIGDEPPSQQEQQEQQEQQHEMGTPSQRERPCDAPTSATSPFCKIFPFGAADGVLPPESAVLLLEGFQRIWAAADKYGIDAMAHTGKLRGKSVSDMKAQHGAMARRCLEWDGQAPLPCGGLHGGWSAMPGGSETQSWRFMDGDGCEHQAPYFWKLEAAMSTHDPKLHEFVAALQYAMEYALLQAEPGLWLRSYEAFGDLDADSPGPGRLYETGMYNQWVLNRNLMLSPHKDHFNLDKVRSHPHPLPCQPNTQHSVVLNPTGRRDAHDH